MNSCVSLGTMKGMNTPRTSEDDWQHVCLPKIRRTKYNTSHLKDLICILIEGAFYMIGNRQSQSHGQPKQVWKGQRVLEAQDRRDMNQVKGGGKRSLCPFHPQEQRTGIYFLCPNNRENWHDYEIKWRNSTHKTQEAARFVIINNIKTKFVLSVGAQTVGRGRRPQWVKSWVNVYFVVSWACAGHQDLQETDKAVTHVGQV